MNRIFASTILLSLYEHHLAVQHRRDFFFTQPLLRQPMIRFYLMSLRILCFRDVAQKTLHYQKMLSRNYLYLKLSQYQRTKRTLSMVRSQATSLGPSARRSLPMLTRLWMLTRITLP